MARNHANNGRIYRAVVVTASNAGETTTYTYGPYDTPAPAKGQITYWTSAAKQSRNRYRDPAKAFSAVGHVESADVVWMIDGTEQQA
jgi:hypothetical protein